MFIVEGPDGAGKSTLVSQLQADLGLDIGKRAVSDRSKLYEVTRRDTYTALSEGVNAHEAPKIWDRLFFSEMVYAPIVGRPCEFSFEEQIFIKRVIGAMGCPIIICRPPLVTVEENVLKADQMSGVKENITGIYKAYGSVAETMPWVVWYDYTEVLDGGGSYEDYGTLLSMCQVYMQTRNRRSW